MSDNSHQDIQYFAPQKKIFPKSVTGKFRNIKTLVMVVCLGIYYFSPFLRWTRAGDIPDQAILIDLPARRAYFFHDRDMASGSVLLYRHSGYCCDWLCSL